MILWRREKQAGLNKKNNSSAWGGPARKLGFDATFGFDIDLAWIRRR